MEQTTNTVQTPRKPVRRGMWVQHGRTFVRGQKIASHIRGAMPQTIEIEAPSRNEKSSVNDLCWIVTVFNNDENTYEQVMMVLMLATGCSAEEAYIEAWEVDHLGKSVVHRAIETECLDVATVIAQIGIRVEATPE